MIIYLDMDGVCVGFLEAACRMHGHDFDTESWPAGEYDIAKVLGIGDEEFWEVIHSQGVDFWRGLEPYPWFERLYTELQRLGRVYFLTSPTDSSHSAAWKMLWLKDRFGDSYKDFVITRQKYLLSSADSILIDDYDRNINAFESYGQGSGILFPQRWNSAYEHIHDDRVGWIIDKIEALQKTQT